MPLRPLVDFVQQHFSDFRGLPDTSQPVNPNPSLVPGDDPDAAVAGRPPMPGWLQQPSVDVQIPTDESATWKIEDEIVTPPQPPGVDQWGSDVLAFYRPFHFYQYEWGIYLLASGVLYVSAVIKGGNLKQGDESFLDLAESLLFGHEAFHFAAEVACSRAEIVAKIPLYRDYFIHPNGSPHEEALANAQGFTRSVGKQPSPVQGRVSGWMSRQGPGYRDFRHWLRPLSFHRGSLRASGFMTAAVPPSGGLIGPADFLFRAAQRYSVPMYRVNDLAHGAVGLLRPFPKDFGMQLFTHSNDHPPPHFHIKRPPGSRTETRYRWPELLPLKGDPRLSVSGQKDLQRYVEVYGGEIRKRIEQVYGIH